MYWAINAHNFFDYLGTFEEALEYEKLYSKHRDSNSFRESQERKTMKRQHPVNNADRSSSSDLIDVTELIRKIDSDAGNSLTEPKVFSNCLIWAVKL